MNEQIKSTDLDLWVMVFTSVKGQSSRFLSVGKLSGQMSETLAEFEDKGFVSRKKQIVPGISKALS